jgi:hypothetical protein
MVTGRRPYFPVCFPGREPLPVPVKVQQINPPLAYDEARLSVAPFKERLLVKILAGSK